MRKYILLLVLLHSQLAFAQNDFATLSAQLDSLINAQMTANNIPGVAACIVKGDQVIWTGTYGLANITEQEAVTLETEFTLASISKLFNATTAAILWQENILDLDAEIQPFPLTGVEINNPNHPTIPITMRQLLNHKSSLMDFESDLQLWDAPGDPIYELDEFCTEYFLPGGNLYDSDNWAGTAPGSSPYWYSNAGFTLAGQVIAAATTQDFNVVVKDKLLNPLQMNSAGWFFSEVDSNGIAMPYNSSLQAYGYYSLPEYPAATLKANILELANFLILYTQKGVFQGQTILSPNTFQTIVPASMTDGLGWWGTDTWWGDPQGDYWSHGGFMNGVRTQLNYYPDDSTGLIILTNGEGSYGAIESFMDDIIPDLAAVAVDISEKELSLAAVYPNPIKSNGFLRIDLNSADLVDYELAIYSAEGRKVSNDFYTSTSAGIQLNNMVSGIYFLELSNGSAKGSAKILVE